MRAGCAGACLAATGCTGPYSALEPHGPAAAHIADLWWVMLAGAALILAGVMAVALYSLKRNRRGHGLSEKRVLIGWGLVFPVATLLLLMGYAFFRGEMLLARPGAATPVFEARARQWTWEFGYPNGARTAGVLHVPSGTTFHVRVRSDDVIHSFWVPQLGGKIDAIPGRANRIALRADAPGRYHGVCAEYCGIGHALMPFVVVAHAPQDYAAALEQAASAPPPDHLPTLEHRRRPAGDVVESLFDTVLRWLGAGE